MRHENQQKRRHSGQRFLLIRNPGFSTVYWIPGQARYDGYLVKGTAVEIYDKFHKLLPPSCNMRVSSLRLK